MSEFELDKRLAADTIELGRLNGCLLLLMNDRRWPWLIPGADDRRCQRIARDLDAEIAARSFETAMEAGKALKQATGCDKINTASIGNMVRQLHIHVVARSEGDANWPAPVWGFGERQEYRDGESGSLEQAILSRSSPEKQW
ncbi:MAG: HIT family protein [Nitratireductor sp.]